MIEKLTTSALVGLIARGAASPEEQEAAERELDLRIPGPTLETVHVIEMIGLFDHEPERAYILQRLSRRGGRVAKSSLTQYQGRAAERLTLEVHDDNMPSLDDLISSYSNKLHFLSMTAIEKPVRPS